ncbi:UNVERIFIED_CONTAM: hypothetical protein GTU68_015275 [Idotea baltica]|nr:hypothetical protein [Idotea baltica]
MVLRTTDGNGDFDWWFILTTEAEVSDEFVSQYNDLIWSDEFDTDGAPDSAKWGYDLGAGGWGNGEVQTYTNDAENVIVDGGFLKINAIKNDNDYSSARLKSQGLFGFTYGRVEVRAKLPASAGTWPAIWMLGDSFSTVGWPQCGEIDIMEQTGANKNTTLGTFHWFDSGTNAQASYGESTTVGTSTTDFHNYSLEWTSDKVTVLVDNVPFVSMDNNNTFSPENKTKEIWPFNQPFYLLINLAIGGGFGGPEVDDSIFPQEFVIDYVKVYK